MSGKKRRLTIIECGCDINMMIDLAKAADLGAKLFYLSGMVHGEYQNHEIHNLGRFITVVKFRPLTWQTSHPYVLADRVGDFAMSDVSFLPEPCALPEQRKKRCLNKEKLVYAPLSGVGRVLYDKHAVYVDLGGSHGFQASVRRESLL
ncbi:ribosome biogenesis protein BMS1 homolog isoform X1 [Macaca fascicularis]|uniref:ribosome biogenesis protein BMS1 homolog isoform X1 n=1 Tax=Macaca fascicularis TaxID=9541 RepID=UPI0032B062BF